MSILAGFIVVVIKFIYDIIYDKFIKSVGKYIWNIIRNNFKFKKIIPFALLALICFLFGFFKGMDYVCTTQLKNDDWVKKAIRKYDICCNKYHFNQDTVKEKEPFKNPQENEILVHLIFNGRKYNNRTLQIINAATNNVEYSGPILSNDLQIKLKSNRRYILKIDDIQINTLTFSPQIAEYVFR